MSNGRSDWPTPWKKTVNAESVGLHGGEGGIAWVKTKRTRRNSSEIEYPAAIQRKYLRSRLIAVESSLHQRRLLVCERLWSNVSASVHWKRRSMRSTVEKGSRSEKGGAGDIVGREVAAEQIGETIMQTAPRVLEAKFVEEIRSDGGGVLADDRHIAELLSGRTVAGVLTEVLVLRVHLNSGGGVWRHHPANEGRVPGIPNVVQPQRIDAAFIGRGVIAYDRRQALEGARQRCAR